MCVPGCGLGMGSVEWRLPIGDWFGSTGYSTFDVRRSTFDTCYTVALAGDDHAESVEECIESLDRVQAADPQNDRSIEATPDPFEGCP
jgi:hypothetical protein